MKKLAVIAGLGVWMISGDWLLGLSTFVLALGWVFLPAEEGPPVLALAYTLQWVSVCVGLYYVAMTGRPLQATLGKMALSIRVTDLAGQRISFLRAIGRNLAKIISGAILLIGYIMAAFTERKQALHDIIAQCLVVRGRA